MTHFKAAVFAARFEECTRAFDLLVQSGPQGLKEIGQELDADLEDFRSRGFLALAFVGEYSAGKSTIISALTGRRDILVSADIATDRTTEYDWRNIKLVDTPGLFTERPDHDVTTYEAIRKSDLLVFCLTHALFDSITVENFKRLAFGEGYAAKMMLVVNKMSAEAGDDETKLQNYYESLEAAIRPHTFGRIPLCFIDALDYKEGVDENDLQLVEMSRFESFTEALNLFVEQRAALAKLDTPIRIVLGRLDQTSCALARDSNEDDTFLEILGRLTKAAGWERENLRNRLEDLGLDLAAKAIEEGVVLAQVVGEAEDFEKRCNDAILRLRAETEKSGEETDGIVQETVESLRQRVSEVLNSDLGQALTARLKAPCRVDARPAERRDSAERAKIKLGEIEGIAKKVGLQIAGSAVRDGAGVGAKGGVFLRANQAAGSELHKGIYWAGKNILNIKFKPWQAVNLAKTLGNVMKVVGPVLTIFSVLVDVLDEQQQSQNERRLAEARREIDGEFKGIARDLQLQFQGLFADIDRDVFRTLEEQIRQARQQEEAEIAKSDNNMAQLGALREQLQSLLTDATLVA